MRYKLTSDIGDGLANAAPLIVAVDDIDVEDDREHLLNYIFDELVNDEGKPFGVGFSLTIERAE